jgi:signal transduction histidine kinase
VFERYYRASTSNGIPGTGIGLNLVQQLLSLQGGRIEVKSALGQGTTFIINLRNVN